MQEAIEIHSKTWWLCCSIGALRNLIHSKIKLSDVSARGGSPEGVRSNPPFGLQKILYTRL